MKLGNKIYKEDYLKKICSAILGFIPLCIHILLVFYMTYGQDGPIMSAFLKWLGFGSMQLGIMMLIYLTLFWFVFGLIFIFWDEIWDEICRISKKMWTCLAKGFLYLNSSLFSYRKFKVA